MKNALEILLLDFQNDRSAARHKLDEQRRVLGLQEARVEQLDRAIDKIETHIETGKARERASVAQAQQLQQGVGTKVPL